MQFAAEKIDGLAEDLQGDRRPVDVADCEEATGHGVADPSGGGTI